MRNSLILHVEIPKGVRKIVIEKRVKIKKNTGELVPKKNEECRVFTFAALQS